jgi:NAD(P)H-hydrate epimerase
MGVVTIEGMLAAEARAIAAGWTEERLLDLAGERLGRAIARFFPRPGTAVAYLGKGHNAGDALVALRVLRDEYHWRVRVRYAFPLDQCAPLVREKWRQLGPPPPFETRPIVEDSEPPLLLLDGLLGSGTHGRMREPVLSLAREMNELRQQAGALVAAVDLPSGIDADSGDSEESIIADATFMIANAKRGLLSSRAANACGSLVLVPVEPLTSDPSADVELIAPQTMDFGKLPRPFEFHKGRAGKVGIVAGSPAYTGAAVLAATGALRGGAGLVTLMVPESVAAIISSKCPPEIIVRGIDSIRSVHPETFDALVLGCGLGELAESEADALLELIRGKSSPAVIDADALNIAAKHQATVSFQSHHVLTPHPGEFARLAPDLADLPREEAARCFAKRSEATLLLKGARTLIAGKDQPLWVNSTGHPGMAIGGQGDLLSGVIGALLAIGNPPREAAALAAWLCGRAAEIALAHECQSPESLTPTDGATRLGRAFLDWRRATR